MMLGSKPELWNVFHQNEQKILFVSRFSMYFQHIKVLKNSIVKTSFVYFDYRVPESELLTPVLCHYIKMATIKNQVLSLVLFLL